METQTIQVISVSASRFLLVLYCIFLSSCDQSPQRLDDFANGINITAPEPAIPEYLDELDTTTVDQINSASQFVRDNPHDADAWNRLGMILHSREMYDLAARNYEQGLSLAPGHRKVIYYRAMTLYEMGRIEDALAELDRLVSMRPLYIPALKRRGFLQLESNRPVEARNSFENALNSNPGDDVAALGLARAHLDMHETGKAIALLEDVLKTPGVNQGYAYRLLGDAYLRAGRREDARRALKRGRSGSIRAEDPWLDELEPLKRAFSDELQKAEQLLNSGQTNSAMTVLKKLREIDPQHATVLGNLGAAYLIEQDFDTSIELSGQALKYSSGWFFAHQNLALAYEGKALNTSGEDRGHYLQLAMQHVDKAIELNPSYARALFLKGRLVLRSIGPEPAIDYFKQAYNADPGRVDWLYSAAQLECQTRRYAACVKSLTLVFESQPPFAHGLYLLATAYSALGKLEEARLSLHEAKRLAPENRAISQAYERLVLSVNSDHTD